MPKAKRNQGLGVRKKKGRYVAKPAAPTTPVSRAKYDRLRERHKALNIPSVSRDAKPRTLRRRNAQIDNLFRKVFGASDESVALGLSGYLASQRGSGVLPSLFSSLEDRMAAVSQWVKKPRDNLRIVTTGLLVELRCVLDLSEEDVRKLRLILTERLNVSSQGISAAHKEYRELSVGAILAHPKGLVYGVYTSVEETVQMILRKPELRALLDLEPMPASDLCSAPVELFPVLHVRLSTDGYQETDDNSVCCFSITLINFRDL